ncbi:hypothetical protein BRPE64_ACDS21400 [Caballeronia insecticola]|uniref:Uncharacterized protein n=1 Tax=Caballeronia insecticola TaxID=758793 RepID=R4WI32_9BURK|nr:hypothetical protein BRPE64_ACDS21400 [Caballeronia insecticola]
MDSRRCSHEGMQVVTVGAPVRYEGRTNDCQTTYRILPMRLLKQYE